VSKRSSTPIQSLPARPYIDPGVFLVERDAIFARNWQFACHVEKLQTAGDFVVCEVAGDSLIVIRESENRINAFYNICAHRAARLLEGEGCKQRISCPYHAWTYDSRGELISAPNAENVPGFDTGDYRLPCCQVEVLNGLVFVCLDSTAAPLTELAPEFADELEAYAPNLPELTFVHRTEALLEANWKVAIENYAECYHCELIHRQLVNSVLDFSSYRIRVFERSQKHFSRPQRGESRAYDFDDSMDTEFAAWWLWPNFAFQNYPGGRVHLWQWTPVDAGHTRLTVDWYFPRKQLAGWERELIEHHARTTFAEDRVLIESVQQGLTSRGFEPGPLMIDEQESRYSEHAVAALQQWWREAMGDLYEP
jgi:phenylpropionate dioxygenase-like ring-hydroxylating dioxygenase large terminal subunit